MHSTNESSISTMVIMEIESRATFWCYSFSPYRVRQAMLERTHMNLESSDGKRTGVLWLLKASLRRSTLRVAEGRADQASSTQRSTRSDCRPTMEPPVLSDCTHTTYRLYAEIQKLAQTPFTTEDCCWINIFEICCTTDIINPKKVVKSLWWCWPCVDCPWWYSPPGWWPESPGSAASL